jgi:hypothetical protein
MVVILSASAVAVPSITSTPAVIRMLGGQGRQGKGGAEIGSRVIGQPRLYHLGPFSGAEPHSSGGVATIVRGDCCRLDLGGWHLGLEPERNPRDGTRCPVGQPYDNGIGELSPDGSLLPVARYGIELGRKTTIGGKGEIAATARDETSGKGEAKQSI